MRAKYDKSPKSLMGRFWRWHINFCPGWKGYFKVLSFDEQNELRKKYNSKNIGIDIKNDKKRDSNLLCFSYLYYCRTICSYTAVTVRKSSD